MDYTIPSFTKGIHNMLDAENIPKDASQDASNFVTQDGRMVLIGGRELLGSAGVVGGVTGFWRGYKADGTTVFYAKRGTAIQYWDGTTWQNSITGLVSTDTYTFANYSSLAGAFTYVNGAGGFWKICNAHPANPVDVYDASKNFKGAILIDRRRMLLWDRKEDKTGLRGSYIDAQNSSVYTTVVGESLGVLGSATYSGTLAFKAGGAKRTCFGLTITSTVAAGTEIFTDNYCGILTSNRGGTGTINYATGAYSVTFSAVTTAGVLGTYSWEDVTNHGLADFSYTDPGRTASQGFVFSQSEGGDPILKVVIGQDGNYYSMKSNSVYSLNLYDDDTGATNQVYRKEIGIPSKNAVISTEKGIFFLNTHNPTKPEMTLLVKNVVSLTVEPKIVFTQFKFSDYIYDDSYFSSFDRWVVVSCRTSNSPTNNRSLLCNLAENTVDVVAYSGRNGIQEASNFYIADSVTTSVYKIFSGYDDLGDRIDAYWTGKNELMGVENLKKTRKVRIKGRIGKEQTVGIWLQTDEQGFQKVGTIDGSASYVSAISVGSIGSEGIGVAQIGGSEGTSVGSYYMEIKLRMNKYRSYTFKVIPEGIGYFDFDTILMNDVLVFENRLPKAYRQKAT